jgi:hypothetical protein
MKLRLMHLISIDQHKFNGIVYKRTTVMALSRPPKHTDSIGIVVGLVGKLTSAPTRVPTAPLIPSPLRQI